jgi:hypothetical protein
MKIKNLLLAVTAIVAFAMTVTAQTIPSYVPTNGLVGWWPFNGNANDESGNGNNGTVNGATLTTDRNGNSGKAYSFDGVNDFIRCNQAGPTGNPTITINFWLSSTQTTYGHLIGYGNNAASGQDVRIFINGNCSNSIAFDTYDNQKGKSTTFSGSWDFYSIIYNGSIGNNTTVSSFYKNGVLMGTECFNVNISSTNISSLLPITFGRYHGSAQTGYYNGSLDDITIYNRILTQQEILQLYTAPCVSSSSSYNLTIPSTSLPYTWNGLIFTNSGSQTAHLTNAKGCDSLATLNLIVNYSIPNYVPTNGLVGYWPFNGNANDESGNGNHGIVNGATLTTDRNGLLNKSFEFNGNNITVAHNNSLNISNSFSVCFWYLSNSNYFAQDLLMKGPDNVPNIWLIRQHTYSINPNVDFAFKTNSNVGVGMGFPYPPINTWSFVVATVENNILRIFQNGVLKNSLSNVSIPSVINNNYNLTIGTLQYSFSGKIDDIAIYNRALTQQEITTLYTGTAPCASSSSNFNLTIPSSSLPYTWNGLTFNNNGSQTAILTNAKGCDSLATLNLTVNYSIPNYVPTNGLVGWWPFNGNANDESGNGNHGTVNGATLTTDRNGVAGKAYSFVGLNNNIKIDYNFFNNGSVEWSISSWYFLNQLGNSNNGNSSHPLFNTSPHNGLGFGLNWGNSSKYSIFLGDGSPSVSWNSLFNNKSNQNVFLNSWHFVTIVRSGSKIKLYIDGQQDIEWQTSNLLTPYLYKMYFGAGDPLNTNEVLNGKLDDIAIYNRALTQTEIAQLYTNCVATTSTTNLTIPSTSLPYIWNGLTFNSTASQTKHLTNAVGCDSSVTLNLTVINTALPPYLPANGLVAWYPFNGNANDESGNGNNATVNGAILVGDRFGDSTNAYSFDGLDDFISSSPNLPINSAPRSVVSWFKTNTIYINTSQYNHVQCINGWGSSTSGKVIFPQHIVAPSGKAWFETGSSSNSIYSNNSVNNFQWHQIVTTYNGSGTSIKLYIDGLLQDSTNNLILNTYNSNFIIGNAPWANIPFRGLIDDVAIYNRALTSSEITSLYNSSQNTINLNLTTFLEGSYSGNSSMTATLNKVNASISNSIADSIIVELHESTSPYATMYSSNGVLNTNGTASIAFPNSAIGSSYYIAIKHRNAIETWSAAPVAISNHTFYNFTTSASQAYGNNLSNMGDGVFGMYSGDINQDGSIDFNDYPDLDIANNSGVLGYNVNDLNGDASVDFNDYPILDINSNNGIIVMRP